MIILNKFPIKIFRRSKNDNIYIYNYDKPFKGETIKIILKKDKILRRLDEDEDYWEFLIGKLVKLSNNWKDLSLYLKKSKFDFCKKVKIYSKSYKNNLKVQFYMRDRCFIYCDEKYFPIDLKKIRENEKLYKKFENRYCYFMNYDHPDSETYSDYYGANLWFQWFYKKYPEYHLPFEERKRNDITVGGCYVRENIVEEPKIDYDYYDLFW